MTRLMLILAVVTVLAGLLTLVVVALRRAVASTPGGAVGHTNGPLQRVAFAMLIGLILYVSFGGGT